MIFIISATLFFIVLRFTVTVFNFISNPKLTRVNKSYTNLVSILIPASNAENNIIPLLESIYQQDYKDYEVLIYGDNSTDNTYTICSAFAAAHQGFHVMKGTKRPDGWTGKNYACHQLAKQASGEYFLFLDADELVTDGLINSAVYRMKLHELGLLSLFTDQVMLTLGEKLVVPLLHFMLLNLLPLRLIYLSKNPIVAAAYGRFMLFDAAVYRENQWHKLTKDKAVEDVEIMKMIKMASYNGEVLLSNGLVRSRMYKNYAEAVNDSGKFFLAAFNYSIPGLLIFIVLIIFGPAIVIMTLNYNLIFFMVSLIVLSRVMISFSAGQNAWQNILLHPLQMISLFVIALLSIQTYLNKGNFREERKH